MITQKIILSKILNYFKNASENIGCQNTIVKKFTLLDK